MKRGITDRIPDPDEPAAKAATTEAPAGAGGGGSGTVAINNRPIGLLARTLEEEKKKRKKGKRFSATTTRLKPESLKYKIFDAIFGEGFVIWIPTK